MLRKKYGMSTKKILFTTLARIDDINESGIYSDLISKFVSEGYSITIICCKFTFIMNMLCYFISNCID